MQSSTPSSLDNLTHLGLRRGVDMRPTLLRVLTDLYVQKLTHTADEEGHYTELALRLLDVVDVATRAAVAGRMARHLSPPSRVILRLLSDLPEVAAPVRGHPVLQRGRETNEPAPRPPVSEVRERGIGEAKTKAKIQTTEKRDDEVRPVPEFAGMIAADIASELNELFFAANADERRLILLNLQVAAPISAGHIQLVPDAGVGQRLENAALARNSDEFAQHLARSLQISRAQARRVAGDELGEPIVVAAKALTLRRDVVYRILLFVNTTVGHSVERVHALAALYDEMTIQAAEHIVAIWQALQRHERATARLRPLLWNDDTRGRARTATATVRRAPAQPPNERRDAS